jgi:hypothetical protein
MNDNDTEHEHTAAVVAQAVEELRAIGVAKQAAYQRSHLIPRQPARLTPQQLAEAYRREGIRNPHRPTPASCHDMLDTNLNTPASLPQHPTDHPGADAIAPQTGASSRHTSSRVLGNRQPQTPGLHNLSAALRHQAPRSRPAHTHAHHRAPAVSSYAFIQFGTNDP